MLNIRAMHPADIDALIHLVTTSFAEEYRAQGVTADALTQQIRLATKGRMLPFRLLSWAAGIQWEMLVAELDGELVGCGGYTGRQKMELSNLMVLPAYRRQGIGQQLLQERLERLQAHGHTVVTTTILETNDASLGNVSKQGFSVFDQYRILEKGLPLLEETPSSVGKRSPLSIRPFTADDKDAFQKLETVCVSNTRLSIEGTQLSAYLPSWGSRQFNTLTGAIQHAYIFSLAGEIVGSVRASTGRSQSSGFMARPFLSDAHNDQYRAVIHHIGQWFHSVGKTTMRVAVDANQKERLTNLQADGWRQTQSWLRLVKEL